jgi:hypothetical protein
MDQIRRLVQPLTIARLEGALRGEILPTAALSTAVDAAGLDDAIRSLPGDASGSELDIALVEPLHRALSGLTRSDAADMRTWHWMTAVAHPDFVWRRWRPEGPPEASLLTDVLGEAMVRRFAGSPSLNGVSRNTFARLWWTVANLDNDYALARVALSRQDMFQAVFERFFGLYPPAARAAVRRFDGRKEGEIRTSARWLNYAAATTVLEYLDEEQIGEIIDEGLLI